MTNAHYGVNFKEHFLEQYKLYVEMSDRISQRKEQTNRLYVTLFSALIASFSIAISSWPEYFEFDAFPWLPIVVGMVGILLSTTWFLNLYLLQRQISVKLGVIREMESVLPFRAFGMEMEKFGRFDSPTVSIVFTIYRPDHLLPFIFLIASTLLYSTSFLWVQ